MPTLEQFAAIFAGGRRDRIQAFESPLNAAMAKWLIETPARQAAFLANLAHESGNLARLEENLSYSPQRLTQVWPARFPTLESATPYGHNPEPLANKVYASRMENGNEESGDGWRYRGRGPIQATGKRNYRRYSEATGSPALENPDILLTPAGGADFAGWFWADVGANAPADERDIERCRKLVNGGTLGLAEVTAIWRRSLDVLGA